MAGAQALLLGGPLHGKIRTGDGTTMVVDAHLYERTHETVDVDGDQVPMYRHREDCCEPAGGAVDQCEDTEPR
jgi:hypothetical protein